MSNGLEPFELASLITAHDEGNFADAVVPADLSDVAFHLLRLR